LFRIPREAIFVNVVPLELIDPTEIVEDAEAEGELTQDSDSPEASGEPVEELPDYEAIIEATEAKLDGLNAEIEAKQREIEMMIIDARAEVEAMKLNAEREAVQVKAAAHASGYQEGKSRASAELVAQRNQDAVLVDGAIKSIGEAKAKALADHEDEIVEFCFDIVRKIFGTDFERGQEELIRQALHRLGADAADVVSHGSVFDYNGETIDASFETQLRKIRDEFAKISRND